MTPPSSPVNHMTPTPERSAIILSGGGLAARIMALCLARSSYPFRWFSGQPGPHHHRRQQDNRTTTVHHAGMTMLSRLGVADRLRHPVCPIERICVSDRPADMRRGADWPLIWEQTQPPMAQVVLNRDLASALDSCLQEQGISPVETSLAGIDLQAGPEVTTTDGLKTGCDLIVGCEGSQSLLPQWAGLSARDQSAGQTALVAMLKSEKEVKQTAYQRFLPAGPLALMPMSAHDISLVWTVSDSQAQTLSTQELNVLDKSVTESFGTELGNLSFTEAPLLWPLKPRYLRRIATGGLVLAGDSAHMLHPLAGMGFNLALADAAVLLDCLDEASARGLGAGHPYVTTGYQKRRQGEILALTATTQMLNRLFSRQVGPISALAGIGMGLVGRTVLKDRLKDVAMGGQLSPAALMN